MKNAKYIFYLVLILAAAGCSHSYKTALIKTRFVNPSNTPHLPLMVDMVIDDTRVTGTFSCGADLGTEYAKTQAVASALKKSNADVLYEPQYQIENTGSTLNVEVSGHPAHYKNFRQATVPVDTAATVPNVNIVQPAPVIVNTKTTKR